MQVIYKSYHVVTMPRLNLAADCWIPTADVSWDEQGRARHQILTGISDRCKLIDEAEINAMEIAIAWIDTKLAGPDTLQPIA